MRERKTKTCKKCNKHKKLKEFGKDKSRKDGYYPYCKTCTKRINYDNYTKRMGTEETARYNHERHIRDKDTQFWKDIKRQFNLDKEEYLRLIELQNYVCAICKQPSKHIDKRTGFPRRLAVDHCHTTNKVRGLLCNLCNTGLGMFADNENNMLVAIEYLKANR